MAYDYFANDLKSSHLGHDICDFTDIFTLSVNVQFILLDKYAVINHVCKKLYINCTTGESLFSFKSIVFKICKQKLKHVNIRYISLQLCCIYVH